MKEQSQSAVPRWLVIGIICITTATGLWAQSDSQAEPPIDQPAWVHFERAQDAARSGPDRDYAEAIRLYSRALAARPVYPEAYIGMARVYAAEGDVALARRYYQQALEQSGSLEIPDEAFELRLELARLLEQEGAEREYRNALQRIVNEDPVFNNDSDSTQRQAMRDRLLDSGLNRVLILYRLNFPQSLEAHRELADYLLNDADSRRREQAIEHLLFAVVEIAGRAVNAIIDHEFDYQFTTIADLILTAQRYPDVQQYLQEMGFIGLLLRLASALDSFPEDGAERAAAGIRRDVEATLSLQR
ncbi:MAG TPA: tetratricopeptide repeat protein [Alkalispirochaeta sp.]|nr:tetratricopeptide repeat protein [Alkalispirochaeta sp.]